jgi:hypothetical protein
MQPIQAELVDNSTTLALTWPDCGTVRLGADTLRRASRAASEIRRQADGIELTIRTGLYVAAVEPIGNYALRELAFTERIHLYRLPSRENPLSHFRSDHQSTKDSRGSSAGDVHATNCFSPPGAGSIVSG